MIADRRFGELRQSWQAIQELTLPMDALDSILSARLVTARTVYKNIDQLMAKVRSEVVTGQKLIVTNCQLTGGESCPKADYEMLGETLNQSYARRKAALVVYQELITDNYVNLERAVALQQAQQDLLQQNSEYVKKFKDNRLARIAFDRARNLYEMQQLQRRIVKDQSKLVRKNQELSRELREQIESKSER